MSALATAFGRDFRDRVMLVGWSGWLLVAALGMLGAVGVAMLYSVAELSWDPYASAHLVRLAVAFAVAALIACVPMTVWRTLAYPAYFGTLGLLLAVEFYGVTAGGATRWIELGPMRLQPSEIMKIALVLALARYYHDLDFHRVSTLLGLIPPILMIAAPVALIAHQPNLGTALLVGGTGAAIVFLAGISWRWIAFGVLAAFAGVITLFFNLKDYQRQRVMTWLGENDDPLGAGYNSLQSVIAIGSGGLEGKGYGQGTQTQLDFLPEKHTDFIFTVIGEEFGFFGGLAVLGLAFSVIVLGLWIGWTCRHQFGRLVALGVTATFALYILVNTGMVMGLAPVVGIPFPLVSYGGNVMIAVMAGFGLVLSARLYRYADPPRRGWF